MGHVNCEQVREWARQLTHERRFKPFADDALYRHVAGCDVCRGALITLSLTEPELLPTYDASASRDHGANLAAFVDAAELAPGSEISIYPALWWHLVSCHDCADEYIDLRAFTQTMFSTMSTGSQPTAQQRRSTLIARFALPRDFLQVALPAQPQQRAIVYRGGHAETHLLVREDVAPGFQATLGVQQDSEEHWSIVVTIIPSRIGQVQLKLGELERQAEFDPAGSATLALIPAEVLLAVEGPAMDVIIHGHETS